MSEKKIMLEFNISREGTTISPHLKVMKNVSLLELRGTVKVFDECVNALLTQLESTGKTPTLSVSSEETGH